MRLIEFLKPIFGTLVVIVLLQATGLLGTISSFTQTAALHSGFLNASTDELESQDDFDFDFMMKDLQGNKIKFDQYKGKVVFINLWATWCGPCRAEMADIQKLYDQVDKQKIAFVMLSIDQDKNKGKVESYIHDRSFTFPVFMPSGYLTEQLNVPSIPTTFVVSKEGKIIMKEVGSKNYNTAKFRKFLDEKSK